MGWKSTIDLTRDEAIEILKEGRSFEEYSDDELSEAVELLRGGDRHGHNYRIVERKEEE